MDHLKEFLVASFCDNTIEIIKKEWLINENRCFFPESKKYNKYIKKNKVVEVDKLISWPEYDVEIIKQFDNLDQAVNYTKSQSGFENSADEEAQKEQKRIAKKHPITSILPDLTTQIKRIKMEQSCGNNIQSNAVNLISENFFNPEILQRADSCNNQPEDLIQNNQDAEIHGNLNIAHNINNFDSGINEDPQQYILVEEKHFKTIIMAIEKLQSDVSIVKDVVLSGNLVNGAGNLMEKQISCKEDLEEFEKKMNDFNYKLKLTNHLKLKGGKAGFNDETNSKVATVLYFLFEENFLKKMNWGSKNGVSKDLQICLVDYPKITEIIRTVLSKENEKGEIVVVAEAKMRSSIQSVFKNHIHKTKSNNNDGSDTKSKSVNQTSEIDNNLI